MNRSLKRYAVAAVALALIAVLAACGPMMAAPTPTAEPEPTKAPEPTATTEPTAAPEPTVAPDPTDAPEAEAPDAVVGEELTTESGLKYVILEEGSGPRPGVGELVSVHYVGTLEDGTEFDNSYSRGEPIAFPLGKGRVIPGWDEGIALLNVGSKARFIIPPELAYGEAGAGEVIPPNATLKFDVELVNILPGSPESPAEVDEADYVVTDSGLKYHDFEVGDGAVPEAGRLIVVHYTGWLEDGTKFDSSLDRGQPFVFPLGQGSVIKGWDEGLASMRVGGKRQLVIPPELGYGEQGAGGVIPPDAVLIFEVELVETR